MERISFKNLYKIFWRSISSFEETFCTFKIKKQYDSKRGLSSRKDFRNAVVAARGAFGRWNSRAAFNHDK